MADLAHVFGNDLSLSSSGDLLTVSGSHQTVQRILRALLTNPGAYIWNVTYGAGLPRYIGQIANPATIQATVLTTMANDTGVAASPSPTVGVQSLQDGSLYLSIQYTDAASGIGQTLSFSVASS